MGLTAKTAAAATAVGDFGIGWLMRRSSPRWPIHRSIHRPNGQSSSSVDRITTCACHDAITQEEENESIGSLERILIIASLSFSLSSLDFLFPNLKLWAVRARHFVLTDCAVGRPHHSLARNKKRTWRPIVKRNTNSCDVKEEEPAAAVVSVVAVDINRYCTRQLSSPPPPNRLLFGNESEPESKFTHNPKIQTQQQKYRLDTWEDGGISRLMSSSFVYRHTQLRLMSFCTAHRRCHRRSFWIFLYKETQRRRYSRLLGGGGGVSSSPRSDLVFFFSHTDTEKKGRRARRVNATTTEATTHKRLVWITRTLAILFSFYSIYKIHTIYRVIWWRKEKKKKNSSLKV